MKIHEKKLIDSILISTDESLSSISDQITGSKDFVNGYRQAIEFAKQLNKANINALNYITIEQ